MASSATREHLRGAVAAVVLAAAMVVPSAGRAAAAAPPDPVVRDVAPPPGFQPRMLPVGGVRHVEISTLRWLAAAEVAGRTGGLFGLDLPDGTVTHARLQVVGGIDTASVRDGGGPGPDTVSWTGPLAGADRRTGEVFVSATRPPGGRWSDAVLTARIWTVTPTGSSEHRVQWTGPGRYAIYQADPNTPSLGDSESDAQPGGDVQAAGVAGLAAPAAPGPGGTTGGGTIPVVITVAVIFTQAAADWAAGQGGITSVVDTHLGFATTASQNSAVPIVYQRVGAVTFTTDDESGDTNTDLTQLIVPGNGVFDEGTALRNSTNADLGLLVGSNYNDACGRASVFNNGSASGFRPAAFGVVSLDAPGAFFCLDTTLAHEVGHLTGGAHDWANFFGNSAWTDNHGFQNPGANIRTIMAEEPECVGCMRVVRWSNPLTPLGGAATGVAEGATPANNGRIFNLTAETIAALMPARTDWYGPGARAHSGGQIELVARGADDGVWRRRFSSSGWSAWTSLGGTAKGDPDIASWGSGLTLRLDAFALSADNAVWWNSSSNGGVSWSGWISLGGFLTSAPTAVSWGTNRIDIFARGQDGALWSRNFTGNWNAWHSLGGTITSDPDVASWGSGRLDVFARDTAGSLAHRAYSIVTNQWGAWESLDGGLTSAPSAVSWGNNRIDMFARGGDGAIWANAWNGSGWHGWYSLGGNLISAPDASSRGVNLLEITARGTNGALYQKFWNGNIFSVWTAVPN